MHPLARTTLDRLADLSVVLSFGRPGYRLRRGGFRDPELELDLSGRTIVVTGASAGLGLATSAMLVERGATVVGVVRSEARGLEAKSQVERGATRGGRMELELCDLSNLAATKALGERLDRRGRIDALVHNAGLLPLSRETTSEGLELAFATNLVAPYLLTAMLVERLAASAPSRVVFVSSGGMYLTKLDLDELVGKVAQYDGVRAYAQTKRAMVVLTERLAPRLAPRGITVNAMHPGWAATPGVSHSLPRFERLLGSWLRDAREGADTIAYLAASPEVEGETGGLYFDRARRATAPVPFTGTSAEQAAALERLLIDTTGMAVP